MTVELFSSKMWAGHIIKLCWPRVSHTVVRDTKSNSTSTY